MVCIHGLNEENCPICRISKYTYPSKYKHIQNLKKIENSLRESLVQYLRTNFKQNHNLKENLPSNNSFSDIKIANSFSKSPLINNLPEFNNTMFVKRMEEIKINNPNKYHLSKKMSLEKPDWQLKKNQKKES